MNYNKVEHIYIHVPFCVSKCSYCAFYSLPAPHLPALRESFVSQATRELTFRLARTQAPSAKTIYMGGGTPSLLAPDQIARFLDTISQLVGIDSNAEITLEANPATLGPRDLAALKYAGVNRLSIGLQSLHDDTLKLLGRVHNAEEGLTLLHNAQKVGFQTSLDLIYGLPEQSEEQWVKDLGTVVKTGVSHLSCYALSVEPGTPLSNGIIKGETPKPPADTDATWFRRTHETLANLGFEGYEVSNFAPTTDQRSQHNLAYWSNKPYLGVGPGAHSFDGQIRRWNTPDLNAWLEPWNPEPPGDSELLTQDDRVLETLMLGFRTKQGVNLQQLTEQFHPHPIPQNLTNNAESLERESLINITTTHWGPTLNGLALADALPLRVLETD